MQENIEAANRLLQIKSAEAKERSEANLKQNTDRPNSDSRGRSDDAVAHELGIGSNPRPVHNSSQAESGKVREKTIVDNRELLDLLGFVDFSKNIKKTLTDIELHGLIQLERTFVRKLNTN